MIEQVNPEGLSRRECALVLDQQPWEGAAEMGKQVPSYPAVFGEGRLETGDHMGEVLAGHQSSFRCKTTR